MIYWQINKSGLLGEVQHKLVVCMAVGVVVHSRVMRGPISVVLGVHVIQGSG